MKIAILPSCACRAIAQRSVLLLAICWCTFGCGESTPPDPLLQSLPNPNEVPGNEPVYSAAQRLAKPIIGDDGLEFAKKASVDRRYGVGQLGSQSWKVTGTYRSKDVEHRFSAALDYSREGQKRDSGEKVLRVGNGMEFSLLQLLVDDKEVFISPPVKSAQDEANRREEEWRKENAIRRKQAEEEKKAKDLKKAEAARKDATKP